MLALCLALFGCSSPFEPDSDGAPENGQGIERQYTPKLMFKNEQRLEDHFAKHGYETGCATEEEYLEAANAVINNPRSLHKLQAEDSDDLYFLESTGEFVVVSPQGFIRTYYVTDKEYFDRQ